MSPTFSPISLGGVGRATVTSTSGSPTVNNNSRAGKTVYEFNGSGSITVPTPGYAEVAIISGGAGGIARNNDFGLFQNHGGGGGGVFVSTNFLLDSGTINITVGGGGSGSGVYQTSTNNTFPGARSTAGSPSAISNTRVMGGGPASSGSFQFVDALKAQWVYPTTGGNNNNAFGIDSTNLLGTGAAGGTPNVSGGAGGGGGGSGGGAGEGRNANNQNSFGGGGNGTTVNITGNAVDFGGGGAGGNNPGGNGGGGANGVAGTANTGGGGGGGSIAGGSGKVIVVIG